MAPKNTSMILGPIETAIVARLTYEKKKIYKSFGKSVREKGFYITCDRKGLLFDVLSPDEWKNFDLDAALERINKVVNNPA